MDVPRSQQKKQFPIASVLKPISLAKSCLSSQIFGRNQPALPKIHDAFANLALGCIQVLEYYRQLIARLVV
jgi:hypothetical protein